MKHAISWFEIPVTNIDRATAFYEAIFGISLFPMDIVKVQMRIFPTDDPATGIGGALAYAPGFYEPSETAGPLIYLNGNPDVQQILDRVEGAGGKILVPKTPIGPDYGFMGIFLDTEGNRIGLHSV
jgi:predicted enzyme related to lactoylglutathione lyase